MYLPFGILSVLKFFIMTSFVSIIFWSIPVYSSLPSSFVIEYISLAWVGPSPKFVNSIMAVRSVGLYISCSARRTWMSKSSK